MLKRRKEQFDFGGARAIMQYGSGSDGFISGAGFELDNSTEVLTVTVSFIVVVTRAGHSLLFPLFAIR
jgi:hypothetical protein